MLKKINIAKETYQDYIETEIADLSRVNLFVGQNNSGKSRLMRKLFSEDELEFLPYDFDFEKMVELANEYVEKVKNYTIKRTDFPFLKNLIRKYNKIKFIKKVFNMKADLFEPIYDINKKSPKDPVGFMEYNEFLTSYQKIPTDFKINFGEIYIPTLRGLKPPIKDNLEDLYLTRTKQDYFPEKEGIDDKIFTGLSLYDDIKRNLLGVYEDREKVNKFQKFLSGNFFQNQRVDLIPNIDNDVLYIKIGDKPDRPIYNLGDGIQSIIILTYPLFLKMDEELLVFIEEPELYLHPGMQRILLNCLTSEFPKHQFFITTHSNHLLDLTADLNNISVYCLKEAKDKKFNVNLLANSDSELLNQLGVKNSSVFLSNSTIWVEGITDRIYIRKYLSLYMEHIDESDIKEDLHYSFVEYQGGNITHWSFLDDADSEHPNINVQRMCSKLFLISDNDGAGLDLNGKPLKAKRAKYERHLKLEKNLGARYYCLKSREIENLISPAILKEVIETREKENSTNLEFKKNFTWEKYKNKKIGDFIESNVTNLKRTYAADSGTIKGKVDFAKEAVRKMNSFEDLTDEAKDLAEKIYDFVKEQNEKTADQTSDETS